MTIDDLIKKDPKEVVEEMEREIKELLEDLDKLGERLKNHHPLFD